MVILFCRCASCSSSPCPSSGSGSGRCPVPPDAGFRCFVRYPGPLARVLWVFLGSLVAPFPGRPMTHDGLARRKHGTLKQREDSWNTEEPNVETNEMGRRRRRDDFLIRTGHTHIPSVNERIPLTRVRWRGGVEPNRWETGAPGEK